MFPKHTDHLVYVAPTLQQGMEDMERLFNVRPVEGGRHPDYGTRNALLSIGESVYLEIIAPDPAMPVPEKGRWLQSHFEEPPHLATWALRSDRLSALRDQAVAEGLPLGEVSPGKRETPEGNLLTWKLSDPYAMPLDGAVPFLIDWEGSAHPAGTIPKAGTLKGLRIELPNPEQVKRAFQILGIVHIAIEKAPEFRMTAFIETPKGMVELQ